MGSLHEGSKGIDASLGGLVWVRRRNGRWWPGRILGPEELPESLSSPKSGTAIKLLGRGDDSVDWYNVEKSTHVKAFRCGEYDDCIEKAEVAAANSSKKIVKHARKENAILHALQIERACLGEDHQSSNSKMTYQQHGVEDSPKSFRHHETNYACGSSSNSKHEPDSAQGLSLSSVSLENPAYTVAYREQTMERTSNNSDDDGTTGVKHMKGLDNLGAPAITSSKGKRFQAAHVREFLKKKHRRRTVTKILESKIMVTVPVVYEELAHPTKSLPQGASSSEVSGLSSDVPKMNFSLKDNDGSSDDALYDAPVVTEEQHSADLHPLMYNRSEGAHVCGGTSDESSQVVTGCLAESGPNTGEVNNINQGVDNGISKWQLKGKRSRHANKNIRLDLWKFTDECDEFDGYVAGAECSVDHNTSSGSQLSDNSTCPFKSREISDIKIDERGWSWSTSDEDPHGSQASAELSDQQRWIPHRESRLSMNSKYQDFLIGHHTADSTLFDVNLVVKADYCPQHVPYVSLTSKLNGPSIIGHLLTIEVLKDGYCDNLISESLWHGRSCKFFTFWAEELGETTTALGGAKLDPAARLNSVGGTQLKHALQNATPSKSRKYGLLSKKIRKLSSLTGVREECQLEKKLIVEQVRGPSLACVPLTIAFNRLNEALHCPK